MDIINTVVFPIIRRDYILPALASLRRYTPPNYRTIVIDQTQPDAEFEEALRVACDLWIKPRKNYGFAQAANMGLRLASSQYVTMSNDDVQFLQDWWEGIERTFAQFETAAAVNPMSPREPGWGYGEPGYRMHATFEEAHDPAVIQRLVEEQHGSVIDGIACWCPVFRADLLQEIGLFDERFMPGGGEDYDWNARCYQAGYRAIATSYSWIWHWWGQSKDEKDGFDVALPAARARWNKVSTKCDPKEGLWDPDVDCWGQGCTRTDPTIYRASL